MPTAGARIAVARRRARAAAASLYAGVYHAALSQGVDPEVILQILRLHAHETDFRRRARVADELELFFDLREEGRGEEQLGELLYSAITAAGESQRFFRFRAATARSTITTRRETTRASSSSGSPFAARKRG